MKNIEPRRRRGAERRELAVIGKEFGRRLCTMHQATPKFLPVRVNSAPLRLRGSIFFSLYYNQSHARFPATPGFSRLSGRRGACPRLSAGGGQGP